MELIRTFNRRVIRRSPLLLPRTGRALKRGKYLPSIDESGSIKFLPLSRHVTKKPLPAGALFLDPPSPLFPGPGENCQEQGRTQRARTIILGRKTNGHGSETRGEGKVTRVREECPDMVDLGHFGIRLGHRSSQSTVSSQCGSSLAKGNEVNNSTPGMNVPNTRR